MYAFPKHTSPFTHFLFGFYHKILQFSLEFSFIHYDVGVDRTDSSCSEL